MKIVKVTTLVGMVMAAGNSQAYGFGIGSGFQCMTTPPTVEPYFGYNKAGKPDCHGRKRNTGEDADVHSVYLKTDSKQFCLILRATKVKLADGRVIDCRPLYPQLKEGMRVYREQIVYKHKGHMQ